jgi:uncharacterized protein involved in exopolysaccharide biosynthesis
MPDSFDAFRYIGYMRSRWRWIAASCGIALVLALAVTMAMPRLYTATARIVIEPPAGSDLRSAMAVSPIYLESLKTYEGFAESDSLFRKAVDQFGLRSGTRPVESLKRSVLKVGIVRNTRILEIAATLPDPSKAQALARFLAESSVDLNPSLVSEGDQDLIHGIGQQEKEARGRLQEIETAWAKVLSTEPTRELQSTMENSAELRSTIEQQIQSAELEIADAAEREKQGSAAGDVAEIRKQAGNARARMEEMRKQAAALDRQAAEREKTLALRLAHRDQLDADRKEAQASLTAVEARLREARGDAGYRGERLRIIDPGIVPERPSSPNLPLNLAAALLLGLVLPIVYFTLELNYLEQRANARRGVYVKARDD